MPTPFSMKPDVMIDGHKKSIIRKKLQKYGANNLRGF